MLQDENNELIDKNRSLEQETSFQAQKIQEVERFNVDF